VPEHVRLEHGPASADLLATGLGAAGWVECVVRIKPGLLRNPVDMKQEHPVEQVQQVVLVAGDAADEYCLVLPGQGLLHPAAVPDPPMRAEPQFVRVLWPADPVTGGILPV